MRSAETEARGTMMNIMLIKRKLMMTCIAYWMKAIMSPTCRLLCSICLPPNQTIISEMPFITSVITGIMVAMARLTKRVLSVRSRLALSNRFCMKDWLAKARTTMMPESSSRLTRFRRSTSFCILLKRGSATANRIRISPSMMISASASTHARLTHLDRPIIRPPSPMIGAKHIMRRPMLKKFWIWVMSLVERVISEAVEN